MYSTYCHGGIAMKQSHQKPLHLAQGSEWSFSVKTWPSEWMVTYSQYAATSQDPNGIVRRYNLCILNTECLTVNNLNAYLCINTGTHTLSAKASPYPELYTYASISLVNGAITFCFMEMVMLSTKASMSRFSCKNSLITT